MACVGNLAEDGAYFTRILIGTAGTVQTTQPAPTSSRFFKQLYFSGYPDFRLSKVTVGELWESAGHTLSAASMRLDSSARE